VSSNQRGENYLKFASVCPHLAEVIFDRVEAINPYYWLYGHTSQQGPFCLRCFVDNKNLKKYAMIAAHI